MIFGLLIKYSSSIGDQKLIDCNMIRSSLRQVVPFLDAEGEFVVIETLDVLQKMVIDKFYASAQSYFRYLSLDIHNGNVSGYK